MAKITKHKDIFSYIEDQEANYKRPIPINDVWSWNMADHIKTTVLYLNSQLLTGKDDFTPVKNIIRPILNLQHRTEDIEMEDVQIYVDSPDKYHLSFLVKKYHDDVFVQENDIDTYIDQLKDSRIDFGAGLSKKLDKPCPEVVHLQSIAFCDQTDILSGPIGIKHYFSPDQLMDMEKVGWGKEENGATITIKELIKLSQEERKADQTEQTATTPGRYIEIYEVHGNLPKSFAKGFESSDDYETRIFICAFYQKPNNDGKSGVILYAKLEAESPFKLIKRDPIYGRALGTGGAEELFEAQVWTNYDAKRKLDLLDAASKVILKASGVNSATIAKKQKVTDMDNLEIIDVGDGDLTQVDNYPRSIALFEKSVEEWEAHAQKTAAANDSIMGESPASGTPFKLQELVTSESRGLHEYRRRQFAKHLEEIYRDWIIPHIKRQITKGAEFLSELSVEELQYVTDAIVNLEVNKRVKDLVFSGKVVTKQDRDVLENLLRDQFKKRGNKHFIKILAQEFKDAPLAVKVSVAGKSKNLSLMVDKITNIFRFIIGNPQGFIQAMQIPGMANGFNRILEFSGLAPADFSGIDRLLETPTMQAQNETQNEPVMAGADGQNMVK